jgi:hypothetical protein
MPSRFMFFALASFLPCGLRFHRHRSRCRPWAGCRGSKLMALAIKFDQLILDRVVKDQAKIARLGFVTRAQVVLVEAR